MASTSSLTTESSLGAGVTSSLPAVASAARPAEASATAGDDVVFYFERGPRVFRRHPFLSWLVLSIAMTIAVKAFWWTVPLARFGRQIVPVSFAVAVIPLMIRVCYDRLAAWQGSMARMFDASPERLNDWRALVRRLANNLPAPTASGLGLLLLAAATFFRLLATGLDRPPHRLAVWAFQGLGTFMAGVALYYVVAFSVAIWRLGRFNVRVERHQVGVRRIGAIMACCWMSAAIIWGAFTSTAVKNPFLCAEAQVRIGAQWAKTPPACPDAHWGLFWFCGVVATLIVASFVLCQLPLHQRMVECKRRERERIEGLLGTLLQNVTELKDHDIARVTFLEARIVAIDQLPEWPFHYKAFMSVATAANSFVVPHLASRLAPQLKALVHTVLS